MFKIAFIDQNPEHIESLRSFIPEAQYQVIFFQDILEYQDLRAESTINLVACHLLRGAKDGSDLLHQIHRIDSDLPVVFLSSEVATEHAVSLMQKGAADLILLPCSAETIWSRLQLNCEHAAEKVLVKQNEREQLSLEIENHQLMNWRTMYANKEVVQTEHLIHEMATAINSSGGYEWLDLLQSMTQETENAQRMVPKDIFDLVIESASSQRKYFEFITFLSRLDKMPINKTEHSAVQFSADSHKLVLHMLEILGERYERPFKTAFPEYATWISGYVCQDRVLLEGCLRELIINAIKYSPEKTPIIVGLDIDDKGTVPLLNIWVRNQPRVYHVEDTNGEPIVGIPHEYAELIFDLFYTIEPYPNKLPEESWTDGAGLYIARKLLKRQGAWLSTSNGVDYSNFKSEAFIKFNISMPLHSKREFSKCNPKCSPCTFMLMKKHARGIL